MVLMGPETLNNMCNNDQFIVSGGSPVPTLCGVNTGNHSKPNISFIGQHFYI